MVAKALEVAPAGSTFRALTGASMAYGLTDGAAQGESISLTELGRRAVAPTAEGDDRLALRDAVLKPRVVNEFLTRYDGAKIPSRGIALNVLEEMGVPAEAAGRAFDMILENANAVGLLQTISGQQYVNLEGVVTGDFGEVNGGPVATFDLGETPTGADPGPQFAATPQPTLQPTPQHASVTDLATNKRVFITHGKNRGIVDQLKEVLVFGGFDPIVSVENEAIAKPVPDKVLDDMRSCGAGIVHVGTERTLLDAEGNEHKVLNPNVLIEIGAALALYRRNFILLVEQGVEVPSNLQGLYQVRYDGDKLDYEATMKLLRAFNEFKNASVTQ
jgi:predicted nucleotide-binding protein